MKEEFYGRGKKGKKDPRRKEKERVINKGSRIIKREKIEKLDQRGHRKKRKSLGRRRRKFFRGINNQGFLDSCSVSLIDCEVFFIESWISF